MYIKKEDVLNELKYYKHLEAYDHINDMEGVEIIPCCECRYFLEKGGIPSYTGYGYTYCTRTGRKIATEWDGWCFRAVRR